MRIYVACLASYNAGTLHGAWIDDLDIWDGDDVRKRIQEMLAASREPGAEEWAIHDYEGFGDYRVSEWHDLDELCAVAKLIAEHGTELVSAALDCTSVDKAADWIADNYQGTYRNLAEWAAEWIESNGMIATVPESLAYYFDYESYARDCESGGDIFTRRGGEGVLVFSNQ